MSTTTIKPFQMIIRGKKSGWRAMVDGKVHDLGDANATQEQAQAKLDAILTAKPLPSVGPTVGEIAAKAGIPIGPKVADSQPEKAPAPKPGEFRKEGLAELKPALLAKLRETFAAAIADANYSVDKALFHIFGYTVTDIPEDTKTLLKIGWELAAQQYFVDGVPPPWLIILFANAQIIMRLAGTAKAKEEKPQNGIPETAAKD